MDALAKALQTARFELPAGIDHLTIHVLGLERESGPLPVDSQRSLIISPFLADNFFTQVHPTPVDILVSRQAALDGMSPGLRDSITSKYVFDDGSPYEQEDAAASALSPADPGRPLIGVHAKVFVFENEGEARMFVGSANATGAAFNNNVEILAELRGPVGELGIDRLLNSDGEDPGLRDLLHVYHPDPEAPPSDGPSDAILDRIRRQIASLPIRGTVEEGGEGSQGWAVTYRSEKPLPACEGVEIHCWPLTTPGNRRRMGAAERFEVRFESSLEALSGFLAFELTHDSGEQTGFAVPAPLDGVPEHRSGALLKALIGSARRFLRYLVALLYDDSDQLDLREVSRTLDRTASDGSGSNSFAVLERVLRTMRSDPLKLVGLHPLIADLRADDALPPGFAELWDAIREATADSVRTQDEASP